MYMTAIDMEQEGGVASLDEVAERLDREIDHLERMRRETRVGTMGARGVRGSGPAPLLPQEIRRELQFLRQLAAGLACTDPGTIWRDRAGFGSVVLARDLVSGRDRFYKLVARRLDPLDAAQVALDSELGRAFLGRRAGDEVETFDGAGARRLRIVLVKTLPERLRLTAPRE